LSLTQKLGKKGRFAKASKGERGGHYEYECGGTDR
jgi:hypothetical protein